MKKTLKTTKDTQLRWFQIRMIHRILPTNRYLCFRKIVDSPLCTFCMQEQETLFHLFWECSYIQTFWQDLAKLLKDKCTHLSNFRFSDILVLFGTQPNVVTDRNFDLMLLWAKYFIYCCQRQKVTPSIVGFLGVLITRYNVVRYIAIKTGQLEIFNQSWYPYRAVLCHLQ